MQHILLLTKNLDINHVKSIIGISMGAMQTFEWLTAYPGFADKAIAIEGTPKQSSYDLVFWKTQAAIINNATENKNAIDLAMRMVSNVGLSNTYSPSSITRPKRWILSCLQAKKCFTNEPI